MGQVTRITYKDKEIILVPTAHVSKESAQWAHDVIAQEQPDSICIELDEARYHTMTHPDEWENTDIIKVIKQKRVGFLLANLALSAYQRRIAGQLDTKVGQEMTEGIRGAEETGAELVLADRSIQATFLRIWRSVGLIDKLRLLGYVLFSFEEDEEISDEEIKSLMEKDMLEAVVAEMKGKFPKIGEILIHERDQYLAHHIKNAPGNKVVAILGAAHVPGIEQEIFKEQDLEELDRIPPRSLSSKAAGWAIPLLIVGLIAYGFFQSPATGLRQLGSWVFWNGTLAAIFTAICLGHPLSILTAFAAAPITSLNPLLACGWFAGLTEASIRKPTVKDVGAVPTDLMSVKGFFKNRFLRILLLVMLANIGSALGTVVAGLDIVKALF